MRTRTGRCNARRARTFPLLPSYIPELKHAHLCSYVAHTPRIHSPVRIFGKLRNILLAKEIGVPPPRVARPLALQEPPPPNPAPRLEGGICMWIPLHPLITRTEARATRKPHRRKVEALEKSVRWSCKMP